MATEELFVDPDGDGNGEWSINVGDLITRAEVQSLIAAALTSPKLLGIPEAPTATAGTNTAQIANTAFTAAAVTAAQEDMQEYVTASLAGTSFDITGKADLDDGELVISQLPAWSELTVRCPGDVMGVRPTNRADIIVNWEKATAPTGGGFPNAVAGVDRWLVRDF